MQHTRGALSHFDILRLPYVTFAKYLKVIDEDEQEEKLKARFKKNPDLISEYKENIAEWRKNQPPPLREVSNSG